MKTTKEQRQAGYVSEIEELTERIFESLPDCRRVTHENVSSTLRVRNLIIEAALACGAVTSEEARDRFGIEW